MDDPTLKEELAEAYSTNKILSEKIERLEKDLHDWRMLCKWLGNQLTMSELWYKRGEHGEIIGDKS